MRYTSPFPSMRIVAALLSCVGSDERQCCATMQGRRLGLTSHRNASLPDFCPCSVNHPSGCPSRRSNWYRYFVRGDNCTLSGMHVSVVGAKSREVLLVLYADRMAAGTDSSGTCHESTSILEMHALSNVERSGRLGRLRTIRDRSESLWHNGNRSCLLRV